MGKQNESQGAAPKGAGGGRDENASLATRHHDSEIFRIGPIYWLAVCNDGMRLPNELHDDFDHSCWTDAFGDEMPDYIRDGEDLAQEFIDRRLFGFLACIDVQQPRAVHAKGYSTNGWGCYWQKWVYAETTAELYEKAKAVASEMVEKRLSELRAALAKAGGES